MKREAWGRQKAFQKSGKRIPNYQEMVDMFSVIDNPRDRALLVFAYLTGGRISEILELKPSNIDTVEIDEKTFVRIEIPNRKNKNKNWKILPISTEKEYALLGLVDDYFKTVSGDRCLFDFTKQRAWQIITKHFVYEGFQLSPHFFRHIRLTHLVTIYGFGEHQLMMFAGWSDPRPAKHYIEMRWQDLAKGF